MKNVAIFREALRGQRSRRRDTLFVAGLLLALAAIVALPVVVIVLLLRQVGLL